MRGGVNGTRYTAGIVIPNYVNEIERHYKTRRDTFPAGNGFEHFGVLITFDQPTEIEIYDNEFRLDPPLRELIAAFGPVILRNAFMSARRRSEGQRNIFGNLIFHLDRGHHMENRYSMFVRDPFDPIQREPRTSSTLIISNDAIQLQALAEGEETHPNKPRYNSFLDRDIRPMVGRLMVEQEWSAPAGIGELCILDNRAVYHASYYKYPHQKGYPIGVRYLY